MSDRVLIVGGGIGGLTFGAALRKQGIVPDIVEVTPEWKPVGAGIVLGINAVGVFRKLGLEDAIIKRGRQISFAHIANAKGVPLSTMDFGQFNDEHGPSIAILRAELHSVLVGANPDVRLGVSVSNIEHAEDDIEVTFTDGSRSHYDLVVGADGIHSVMRELLFGSIEDRYSGYTCWRLMVELDDPPTDMIEMWGAGRRFGIVPLAGKKVYCYATLNCLANDPQWKDISLELFRSLFAGFGGDTATILNALDAQSNLIQNDLAEVQLNSWSTGAAGLLGDAAHAMTPNMGQGAAMAIEDAWTLAEEIDRHGAGSKALKTYEKRRSGRARMVQQRSWTMGKVGQWTNPVACALRNQLARWSPDSLGARGIEALLTEKY